MSTLTEQDRHALWEAGDHHPEMCDCAGDDWSAEGEWCGGLEDTFAAVEAIVAARVAAERDRLLGKLEALLPVWSGGDVVHDGGFSHSSALQCERCPGWPHASCVHPADLRALVAEIRGEA